MWGSFGPIRLKSSGWWRHHLPAPLGWEISSCPCCSPECSGCCLRDSRESCVLQMMTSGIKALRGAILSPVQSAVGGWGGMCVVFGELCGDWGNGTRLPTRKLNVFVFVELFKFSNSPNFALIIQMKSFRSLSQHMKSLFHQDPLQDKCAQCSVVYHANIQDTEIFAFSSTMHAATFAVAIWTDYWVS